MRYTVEVHGSSGAVYGHVTPEGTDDRRPFHGWLELLSLLEPSPPLPAATEPPRSTGDSV